MSRAVLAWLALCGSLAAPRLARAMDKNPSCALQSRGGSGAPPVLSVQQEELPALEIMLWVISKQENCFTDTEAKLPKILDILHLLFEKEQHKRHKIAAAVDYRLQCVPAEIGFVDSATSKLM
ncbi:hypothetical protein WISP_28126 [Willisornis vidua]|uniref:Uncharacterized protein n=1 Tax=Willisornis vidua TaxID=1566151 RepID=A0ABQ9DSB2_9PASS|nr:hypothetical protein WISP_28126 [Willisornis vidua]